jgi:hypothetical protein
MSYVKFEGTTERGGAKAVKTLIGNTIHVQESFPGATVAVYNAGTLDLAALYSDAVGTVKANPFTATALGTWDFFAEPGLVYDVVVTTPAGAHTLTVDKSLTAANALTRAGGAQPLAAALNVGNQSILSRNSVRVFNVEAFGAVPQAPGETPIIDSTAAIQAAIDAALATTPTAQGAVVYFPNLSYRVTSLTIGHSSHLRGNHAFGSALRRIPGTYTAPMIGPKASAYSSGIIGKLVIEGLSLFGENTVGDALYAGDLYSSPQVVATDESQLSDLRIQNFARSTPYTTGTITATASSATITGAGTSWTADMVGRWIEIGPDKILRRILTVNVGAQTLTVNSVMNALFSGGAGLSYSIFLGGMLVNWFPDNGKADNIWLLDGYRHAAVGGFRANINMLTSSGCRNGGTDVTFAGNGMHVVNGITFENSGSGLSTQAMLFDNVAYGATISGLSMATAGTVDGSALYGVKMIHNTAGINILSIVPTQTHGNVVNWIDDRTNGYVSVKRPDAYRQGGAIGAVREIVNADLSASIYTIPLTLGGKTLRWTGTVAANFRLPAVANAQGWRITVVSNGTTVPLLVQSIADSGTLLWGAASRPLPIGESMTLESDGARWYLVAYVPAITGAWITPTFDAGAFTASAGTWTVDSADRVTLSYILSGKTMTVSFVINGTSVSATPSTLSIAIPGGFAAAKRVETTGFCIDGGTNQSLMIQTLASNSVINLYKFNGNWSASTDTTAVRGQITFEIQ